MIRTDDTFVVLIDVQDRLLRAMDDSEVTLQNVVKLIKGAKALEIPIIWLEQNPKGLGQTVADISNLLEEENPIIKFCFSCYGNPDFKKAVSSIGRKNVLICGIEAHVCVYQTAVDLKEAGYNPQVVFDATSSRSIVNKMIAKESLRGAGVNITSVETALFELLKVAEGEKFKEILTIIK